MEKNTTPVGEGRFKGQNTSNNNLGTAEVPGKNPVSERYSTGKYRIYWDYLEWLGLGDDSSLLVLSPTSHYYYDDEELKGVKTLLNLKHLNHIREVKRFLTTVNDSLSYKSFFIGSFIDRRHQYGFFSNSVYADDSAKGDVENGISSRIPLLNMIYDFMDSRTNNRNMTRKSVTSMLEQSGFKVYDMTEINGITCFCAQKITQ